MDITNLASLDRLPNDILLHISTFLDERSIWRAMATCRMLRSGVQEGLKPYLAERHITPDPPLCTSVFQTNLDENRSIEDCLAFSQESRQFLLKLSNLPLSASMLCRLTIQVSDDDSVTGWSILPLIAAQLEQLDLHIIDKAWVEVQGQEAEDTDVFRHSIAEAMWPKSILDASLQFTMLTHLTIVATARTWKHLQYFLSSVPNLITLAVNCHGGSDCDYHAGSESDFTEFRFPPSLVNLIISEHLCCNFVHEILRDQLPRLNHIRSLIRECSGWLESDIPQTLLLSTLEVMAQTEQLSELALYGYYPYNFSSHFLEMSIAPQKPPNITVLVLDRLLGVGEAYHESEIIARFLEEAYMEKYGCRMQRKSEEELDAERDKGYETIYPILCDIPSDRPIMPNLERLVWVDRRLDTRGCQLDYPGSNPIILYDDDDLGSLFQHYPSLLYVQWVNDYSTHPFDEVPESQLQKHNVICRVMRPQSDELLVQIRPSSPSSDD